MRIKPFKAVYPDFRFITSVDTFFGKVKEEYSAYKKSGFFQQAEGEALFVYEIIRADYSHTGLVALADIHDYLDGKIKKHENTLPAKEQQQMQLLMSRKAQVKPVLLTCEDVNGINDLLFAQKTESNFFFKTTFEDTEEEHSFWSVHDPVLIKDLQDKVASGIPRSYIADGHHRSSTMARLYDSHVKEASNPYSHLLVVLFPKSQLEVHDYNRVVEGLIDVTLSHFVAKLSALCNITPIKEGRKPEKKHQMTMFLNKEWYLIEWRPWLLEKHKDDPVLLDTALLDTYVLKDILDIADIRTDEGIRYVEGPAGIEGLRLKTSKNEQRVAFCFFPTSLEDLFLVANRGEVMPPKSTWFEPRIKNGLMVYELDINK